MTNFSRQVKSSPTPVSYDLWFKNGSYTFKYLQEENRKNKTSHCIKLYDIQISVSVRFYSHTATPTQVLSMADFLLQQWGWVAATDCGATKPEHLLPGCLEDWQACTGTPKLQRNALHRARALSSCISVFQQLCTGNTCGFLWLIWVITVGW